jgi:hypothetical protein
MRTTLQNEKVTLSYNGSQLLLQGHGLKISIPVRADTLLTAFGNKSKLQVAVDVEINK